MTAPGYRPRVPLPMIMGLALLVASSLPASSQLPRPDIVLILTDDQRWDTMRYMPLTSTLLGGAGVRFTNGFVSTPSCCPSRASILTGLYSHNHGVIRNKPPQGGAPRFKDASTIATWLKQAAYRTGLFGKYLNHYDLLKPWPYLPPGWDEWHAFKKGAYYDYVLVENGREVHYGDRPEDYSTDVLARKAVQFIETTPPATPLLLYFAPKAPHGRAIPAPPDKGKFDWFPPWRPPSYNEADVSDKPKWVRSLPLLTPAQQSAADALHRRQLETLQAVDRAVAAIVDALARVGRLTNAAIVYTSDNGRVWGEHRWLHKECTYEECVRVPFLVRAPGAIPRTERRFVLNIDLAPTFAEWAGVSPPWKVNGASLAGLVRGPVAPWRTAALFEYLPGNRAFQAVRTARYVYAEYVNGDREFYDLQIDPYQLVNSISDPAYEMKIVQLQAILDRLRKE